jgi:hypothetical protein
MAIAGQEYINIGEPNQAAGSDTLYTAFTKAQNNFTQLFSLSSPIINASGGTGITANITGNTLNVTNTGVTNIIAGTNIVIDQANGNVTISSTGGGGGSGGTVTSVGVSSSTLSVAGSPVVSSGNITLNLPTQANVTAGSYTNPNVTVDGYGRVTNISSGPASGTVTSVSVAGGSGINVVGSPITSNGTITLTNTGVTKIVAGSGIGVSSATGEVTIYSTAGGGTGTVTSVAVSSSSLTVTGSPIITAGTITVDLPSNVSVTGSTTIGTFLKLTPSTAPSSPTAGTVYYDSGMNKLRVYNGTSWGNVTVT